MNKRIATLVLFLLSLSTAFGQTPADANDDKFYVVGGVLTIIFAGLAVFMVILDRKISKVEKQRNEKLKK